MGTPSVPTIKRLFAVSGNQCAFPNCVVPLVDKVSGKVTGRICHIKARQEGGPRYDPNQIEEERHSFENLVLMCPIHHDVIDSDPTSYTVERLQNIKSQNEIGQTTEELSDAAANQFIVNVNNNLFTHGSLIFSQNQIGGQIAHSITNIGPQPRNIHQASANVLIGELREYPPEIYQIMCAMGDTESHQLALRISETLNVAGWQGDIWQFMMGGILNGVIVQVTKKKPSLNLLLNWMGSIGLKPSGELVSQYFMPEFDASAVIFIGTDN